MYSNFSNVFPFSSFADSIINFPSPSGHLKPIQIDDAREQTNQRPGQPPLKPTCFAAARTSNMSLHASGHVVAPKSGLFACHHASNADGEPRKNGTLNQQIDDAREQTNLRPGQPPETNLPGCRTSPVDLAKPWEHLKPTCFAAARTSNMSLHASGHVVAPKSGLFACHHASNADGEPRKNDTLNQQKKDAREQTNQSTAWIAT